MNGSIAGILDPINGSFIPTNGLSIRRYFCAFTIIFGRALFILFENALVILKISAVLELSVNCLGEFARAPLSESKKLMLIFWFDS